MSIETATCTAGEFRGPGGSGLGLARLELAPWGGLSGENQHHDKEATTRVPPGQRERERSHSFPLPPDLRVPRGSTTGHPSWLPACEVDQREDEEWT